MNKTLKITLAIVIPVVVVIAAVITILALVKTRPLKDLGSYQYATIYKSSEAEGFQIGSNVNSSYNAQLKALIEDCEYSTLQSLFSGRTDLDNENYYANGEEVTLKMANFTEGKGLYDAAVADGTVAKIKLTYEQKLTGVIGKEEYTFDTVEFLVPNTNGEIREVTAVAYVAEDFTVQGDDGDGENVAEYNEYCVFKFHANTSALYAFVNDLNV